MRSEGIKLATDFWDVAPCSLEVVDWRFSCLYYLHHQGYCLMMGAVHLRNVPHLLQKLRAVSQKAVAIFILAAVRI
jgi:hypothetical protein